MWRLCRNFPKSITSHRASMHGWMGRGHRLWECLDIMMVCVNPPGFSKPPKLVKTDIMRINKTPPFFRR